MNGHGPRRPRPEELKGGIPIGQQPQEQMITLEPLPPDFVLAVEIEGRTYFCAQDEYAQPGLGLVILVRAYRRDANRTLCHRRMMLMGIPHITYGCVKPEWWDGRIEIGLDVRGDEIK